MGGLPGTGAAPLIQEHDLLLMDLDGVVYIGMTAVPGAVDALNDARHRGTDVVYVTNNASRPASQVREHLEGLGVQVATGEVLTSAQATASFLLAEFGAGTAVMAIGGPGVRESLEASGLVVVDEAEAKPAAVVMGFGPDVSWRDLAHATRTIRAGAAFIATNTDLTVPTPFGPAPGNGALVRAVADATGVEPRVIGKPQPTMFEQAVRSRAASRPLVVGDRLDTDIQGAVAAGMPSLLVMSGVTDALALVNAAPRMRPTYLAADLRGLQQAHPPTVTDGTFWRCGAARAQRIAGRIEVTTAGGAPPDSIEGLRAACAAAWAPSSGDGQGDQALGITDVVGLAQAATR